MLAHTSETVWAFVGMNKIEFNPRKSRHIKYLERRIVELHEQIFADAMHVVTKYDEDDWKLLRMEIQNNISLQKKYRRRLNLLNL